LSRSGSEPRAELRIAGIADVADEPENEHVDLALRTEEFFRIFEKPTWGFRVVLVDLTQASRDPIKQRAPETKS
jgi:hypothetical protein